MVIEGIPTDQLLHNTPPSTFWIEAGRKGRHDARLVAVQLRLQLSPCASSTVAAGPLSEATSAHIQTLPLAALEALAEALLDFSGPADLATWWNEHGG
jgi:hypothetical protein